MFIYVLVVFIVRVQMGRQSTVSFNKCIHFVWIPLHYPYNLKRGVLCANFSMLSNKMEWNDQTSYFKLCGCMENVRNLPRSQNSLNAYMCTCFFSICIYNIYKID